MIKFKIINSNKLILKKISKFSKEIYGLNHVNSDYNHLYKKHLSLKKKNNSKILIGYFRDTIISVIFLLKKKILTNKGSIPTHYLCDLMIKKNFRFGMNTLNLIMNNKLLKNLNKPIIHISNKKTHQLYVNIFKFKKIKSLITNIIIINKIMKSSKLNNFINLHSDKFKDLNLKKITFKSFLKNVDINNKNINKKYHLDKKRYFYNYVRNNNSFMAYEIETNKMNRGYLLIRKLKDRNGNNLLILCDSKFNLNLNTNEHLSLLLKIIVFFGKKMNFILLHESTKFNKFFRANFLLAKNKSFQFESDYPVFLNNPTIKRINLIKKINFSYSDFDFYFNY